MKKIKLTQGQFALVDDEDYEKVNQFKWCAHWNVNHFYAKNNKKGRMHRYIMNTPVGMFTDHKNHNTLDNQKSNLRICTYQQNQANRKKQKGISSKYKGVCWDKQVRKWLVGIRFNQKRINLGRFKSEIKAAIAYNKKAKELFGAFALLNKI